MNWPGAGPGDAFSDRSNTNLTTAVPAESKWASMAVSTGWLSQRVRNVPLTDAEAPSGSVAVSVTSKAAGSGTGGLSADQSLSPSASNHRICR